MRTAFIAGMFCAVGVGSYANTGFQPEIVEVERYKALWERRPFSPPTPAVSEAPTDGVEQQFALGGLLKVADSWIAFVLDRKSLQRHSVTEVGNEAGLQLVSVEEKDDPKTSSVVLRSGTRTGVVRYDQSLLNAANQASAAEGQQPSPPGGPNVAGVPAQGATPPAVNNNQPRQGRPPAARTLRRSTIQIDK